MKSRETRLDRLAQRIAASMLGVQGQWAAKLNRATADWSAGRWKVILLLVHIAVLSLLIATIH